MKYISQCACFICMQNGFAITKKDKSKLKKYCKRPTGLDAFIPKTKGLDDFL